MNDFRIGGAWSLGFRFFAGHWLAHALILTIIGLLVPLGLDYALVGDRTATAAGPGFGLNPAGSRLFDRPELLLVLGLGYLFQTGSYFTSWRLGFDDKRSVAGALLFGLPAGLVAVLSIILAFVLAAFLWAPLLTPDTAFIAVLVFLVPLILVSATFFVAGVAFVAAAVILLLGFAMIYGAAMGQMGLAATVVGGNGSIAVLLLLLSGLTFWVAARLSCVTPLMAERKSLNLFAAVRGSWRLTWEEQWVITRYLALVGGVLALLVIGGSIAIGASTTAILPGGAGETGDNVAKIAGLLLGIPFAFLAVMIPAGIYRQLVGEETQAAIFE